MSENTLSVVQSNRIPEGWIDTKKGQKRSTLSVGDVTVLLLKAFNTTWRFNQLTMLIELDGVPIPDKEIDLLWVTFSLRGWHVAKNAAIDGALAAAYANAFNPVQEYLDRIAADPSIVPADLSKIATTYLDTKDDLYDAMLRATLIGAVNRAYSPGCMFKTALVFKGEQDIGKSSVVRNLAGPDWTCDTSQDSDKDFLQAIHSGWLYELAELDSIVSRKEAGRLKNLISSPKDTFRPPYGRRMEAHKRQSIFIATCNRDNFLRDETGACRWWVVELPHNANKNFMINHDRVRQDRDAIWKASVLAFRAGELPLLTYQQQAESNRRNLGFEVDHPWEDYIADWFHDIKRLGVTYFSAEQALNMSGALGACSTGWNFPYPALPYKDSVEVGKILRRLGCTQDKNAVRKDGKRRRWWHPPADTSDTEVSNDHVPALTAAVATDSSDLAHGTSDSSKKDSPSINTPAEAAALLGKTPVPPVPGEDPTLFLAEDYFDNVAPGSAWDV
jgi:hypothetical protein